MHPPHLAICSCFYVRRQYAILLSRFADLVQLRAVPERFRPKLKSSPHVLMPAAMMAVASSSTYIIPSALAQSAKARHPLPPPVRARCRSPPPLTLFDHLNTIGANPVRSCRSSRRSCVRERERERERERSSPNISNLVMCVCVCVGQGWGQGVQAQSQPNRILALPTTLLTLFDFFA